jgi:hypothetical protein
MVEAVRLAGALVQPQLARGLEERVRADDVGGDERIRPGDRAVDMALRREVDDGADTALGKELSTRSVSQISPSISSTPSRPAILAGLPA